MVRRLHVSTLKDSTGIITNSAWILLQTFTASNDSSIDITGLTSEYFLYKFYWTNLIPATDAANLYIRTSTNGGSSYDSGASDYAAVAMNTELQGSETMFNEGVNANNQITSVTSIGSGWGSDTDENLEFELLLFNPSNLSYTRMLFDAIGEIPNGRQNIQFGGGVRLSAADVDAIQFLFSSGNIESGILKIYGLKA